MFPTVSLSVLFVVVVVVGDPNVADTLSVADDPDVIVDSEEKVDSVTVVFNAVVAERNRDEYSEEKLNGQRQRKKKRRYER